MRTIKLTLEYDGTDFVGWQVQPSGRSVQEVIERALATMLKEPTKVMGAGRTDAGVHAAGQVCSLRTERTVPMRAFVMGLNSLLPPDVAVLSAEEMAPDFHARHSASGKRYEYRIRNAPTRSPLFRRTHWEIYRPLDVEAMRAAAAHFVGEHDFSAFRASDCAAKTTRRLMRRFEISTAGQEIVVTVEATAFLKHMVRNLVGTLVQVGLGRRDASSIPALLTSGDRTQAGATAPPQGLVMAQVFYDPR